MGKELLEGLRQPERRPRPLSSMALLPQIRDARNSYRVKMLLPRQASSFTKTAVLHLCLPFLRVMRHPVPRLPPSLRWASGRGFSSAGEHCLVWLTSPMQGASFFQLMAQVS